VHRIAVVITSCVLFAGCAEWQGSARSVGITNSGWLREGVSLPDRGLGFVRARPGESTRFGSPEMVGAIERAAAAVNRAFPASAPLKVGDIAAPFGGEHERHASHRTGRDVDLTFFVTDLDGRSLDGRAVAFDRHGVGRGADDALVRFDVARNWELVRTFLLDEQARVQWIFCSHGVKAMLLRYAARFETNPDAIARAADVLHQPSNGRPHDDHFHVRLLCSASDAVSGCRDHGPRWPWLRASLDERSVSATYDDATLLHAMREQPDELEPNDSVQSTTVSR
jgi:penicillin-insensitive murein endopeptidase